MRFQLQGVPKKFPSDFFGTPCIVQNFLADDPFKVLTVDTGTNDIVTGTATESNVNSIDTTDIVSVLVLIY